MQPELHIWGEPDSDVEDQWLHFSAWPEVSEADPSLCSQPMVERLDRMTSPLQVMKKAMVTKDDKPSQVIPSGIPMQIANLHSIPCLTPS